MSNTLQNRAAARRAERRCCCSSARRSAARRGWSSASCSRSSRTSGRTGSRTRSSCGCTARRKSGPSTGCTTSSQRLAQRAGLPQPRVLRHPAGVAERVRDRPQSGARRRGGDRRHPADSERRGARGRDRARAGARQAPRHPDQLGRGDAGGGDHDGVALRDVLRRRPRRRSRGAIRLRCWRRSSWRRSRRC